MNQNRIAESLHRHLGGLEATVQKHGSGLERLAQRLVEAFHDGGRLIVLGSGPFSAAANLVASYFNLRLSLERPLLPAISLGHDALLAQSLGQDDQLAHYFSRQLRVLGGGGDVVLALADGGRDAAVVEGLAAARQAGSVSALFFRGAEEAFFGERPDFLFDIAADGTASALEVSLFCGRVLCELVEAELFGF